MVRTAEYVCCGRIEIRITEKRTRVIDRTLIFLKIFVFGFSPFSSIFSKFGIVCHIKFRFSSSHSNYTNFVTTHSLRTMTSKRSEVIRLRDILTKIPGVTKILWTELCAIVHDRLEKGKVRLSLYPPISFFSTLNLKQTKIRAFAFPNLHASHF